MLAPGTPLGPYVIASPLGAGGMGEVYRARDPRLGREVAIKVIRSDSEPDADRRRRFEDEARAAGALNHPNVLSVFDVGFEQGQPYVVFELLEGETLADRLERGPLPARKAIDHAVQVCQGLAAAHAKGIVHRDLKPANLFLGRDGHVKILDFGLAKLTHGAGPVVTDGETSTGTQPGLVLGTLSYLSPEQARGEGADPRSDLFALGATLYEMLSGRPAFRRATAAETVSAILTHDPEALTASKEPLPAGLETIVRRCLEKDPEQRFQSARDLGFALSAVAGSTPSGAGPPVVPRRRGRWLLVAGLALAAGAGAAYLLRPHATPTASALVPVPFTAYPGLEFAPTFSPDGSQIAFAWSPEGTEGKVDLYTKVIGSEKALRLTTEPADWITPAWSPDGRSIAFARVELNGVSGIYLIPALGGPARKLAAIPFGVSPQTALSWSPDGKLLAFADEHLPQSPGTISILDMATLQKRRLGQPDPSCQWSWMPAFSPDGSSLARVCVLSMGVNEVFVEPVSGGVARRVAHVDGEISGFAWSGDGKSLVVAALGSLLRVPAAGGEPQRLLSGRDVETPAISRDGRRLAYAQHVINTSIWRVALTRSPAVALRPTPLISSTRRESLPAYSPDGRRLAFTSSRSGSSEVWISDADGANPRPLTSFGGPATGSPRWSPDGRWVALDSRARGRSDVYVVASEGGLPRRVETGQADSETPFWSVDGEWLYFSAPVDGMTQVFKVRQEGGRATRLTGGGGAFPQSAADGKRVYYSSFREVGIWSVSSSGGDERPVAGMPLLPWESIVSWALGPDGIHFLEGGRHPAVVFFHFATARARRVADLPGAPDPWSGIALSPDGRSVLFSKVEHETSDIMLIEDFR